MKIIKIVDMQKLIEFIALIIGCWLIGNFVKNQDLGLGLFLILWAIKK